MYTSDDINANMHVNVRETIASEQYNDSTTWWPKITRKWLLLSWIQPLNKSNITSLYSVSDRGLMSFGGWTADKCTICGFHWWLKPQTGGCTLIPSTVIVPLRTHRITVNVCANFNQAKHWYTSWHVCVISPSLQHLFWFALTTH